MSVVSGEAVRIRFHSLNFSQCDRRRPFLGSYSRRTVYWRGCPATSQRGERNMTDVSIEDIGRRHKQIRARNRSLPIDHLRFEAGERPISYRELESFERPFPALTPGQRLHLDLF